MFAYCGSNPVSMMDPSGYYRTTNVMMTDTGGSRNRTTPNQSSINNNPYNWVSFNNYESYGNTYSKTLYLEKEPPSFKRGISLGSINTGIATIGGNYKYASWSLSTVTLSAKAGFDKSFLGVKGQISLASGEVGFKIPLPFTSKKLYVGLEGDLGAFGYATYYDSKKKTITGGWADVLGGFVQIGIVD